MRRLTHTSRADHQAIDIPRIHQRGDSSSVLSAAHHNALCFRKILSPPPEFRLEWNKVIGLMNFLFCGKPGCAVLSISYGAGLDIVEVIMLEQDIDATYDPKHQDTKKNQRREILC